MTGGRSASARRLSQAAIHGRNYQMLWSSINVQRCGSVSSMDPRRESGSFMHRRRALDLYGTKDVLFTHEQMKRTATRCGGDASSASFHAYRWVSNVNRHNSYLFLARQTIS
ncbi:unnamed protein product [Rotaria magnacalcarata]|nr:unnamed protein product [Rotaria magnacalcarata]CAF3796393.1 unnamed protein product [Rotaria magnacalcarata]CAF4518965.1 unnamed protein product [Rotaria magnacalcarata]CAF4561257.1 unnamed protein product [Rotaria magnacalcarata]